MKKILALFASLLISVSVFGQGTAIRAQNGQGTNTTIFNGLTLRPGVTAGVTNVGPFFLRLGADVSGTSLHIIDTNAVSRITIVGQNTTLHDEMAQSQLRVNTNGVFVLGNGLMLDDSSVSTENSVSAGFYTGSIGGAGAFGSTGSAAFGDFTDANVSQVSASFGSFAFAKLNSATNCFVQSSDGALAFGQLTGATDSTVLSQAGGFAGGSIFLGTSVALNSSAGVVMGEFNAASNSAFSSFSSFLGVSGFEANNVRATTTASLMALSAFQKTNISLTLDRSAIVGGPPNGYTNTFESTVAVIANSGFATGFDTNGLFGFLVTNAPSIAANSSGRAIHGGATNTWGNAVVPFDRGPNLRTNMAGNLTITGVTGFQNNFYNTVFVRLVAGGSDRTLVVPDAWLVNTNTIPVNTFTNATTATIAANTLAWLMVEMLPGIETNAYLLGSYP